MPEVRSKTGQGAFWLCVNDDGSVDTALGSDPALAMVRNWETVQEAYDHYREIDTDAACWNLAYHLEDFLPSKADPS